MARWNASRLVRDGPGMTGLRTGKFKWEGTNMNGAPAAGRGGRTRTGLDNLTGI
jgi:hypothetical protein